MPREATVLIVPALRDHVPEHCQTLLASRLPRVDPIGRDNLDCLARIEAIEEAAASTDGTIIIVAHSAASLRSHIGHGLRVARVRGALLAAPADFDRPLPEGYPSLGLLRGRLADGAAQRSTPRLRPQDYWRDRTDA